MAREFDVVLFGVTGFTGRLVAEYLAKAAPAGARIALAGRSKQKLDQVADTLPAVAKGWARVVADSGSDSDMDSLASRTTVVCTTVGPYELYGKKLVAACAKAGTHCCDLTGEVAFMRGTIDACQTMATSTGAKLVHTCGFDSIPSDLGVWVLHRALGKLGRVTYVVEKLKGAASGGTVASALHMFEQMKDRQLRRIVGDPYALSPARDQEPDKDPGVTGRERDLTSFKFDDFTRRWIAPFFMAPVNTRVVRRSNALLGWAYGRKFRYAEVSGMGTGPAAAVRAGVFTAGLGAFFASLATPVTRGFVMKRLPKPGEGPDETARKNGRMRIRVVGESETGTRADVVVYGQGDPGYQLTSVMLGESALCLAFDGEKLPQRSGVLTPATAMGDVLVDRLNAAGITFTVERH